MQMTFNRKNETCEGKTKQNKNKKQKTKKKTLKQAKNKENAEFWQNKWEGEKWDKECLFKRENSHTWCTNTDTFCVYKSRTAWPTVI